MKGVTSVVALFLLAVGSQVAAQARELPDFTQLVENQGPTVVNISTKQAVRRSALPQIPGVDDEELREFFRRFMPRRPPVEPGPRSEARSLGSGFIISEDGYILTNAHVIEGADEIDVRFTDKHELKARVIGSDKRTDVALINNGQPRLRRETTVGDVTVRASSVDIRTVGAGGARIAFLHPKATGGILVELCERS